jgi:hypothetical protein
MILSLSGCGKNERSLSMDTIGNPFSDVSWRDAVRLGIEGRGWDDTRTPYERLPARAKGVVRDEVWAMSVGPAGLNIRFATNAEKICVRWRPTAALEVSGARTRRRDGGFDCYGRGDDETWYWTGAKDPWTEESPDGMCDGVLNGAPLDGAFREYRVYLPLKVPLDHLDIGVPGSARFESVGEDNRPPVVVYGTSICHGTCVSRPGMTHLAILGRRLDYPVINLGFGGNGMMEPEVVQYLTEIDAALFIIDCLPNMSPALVAENMPRLVSVLRGPRSDVPILFIGNRLFGDAAFIPSRRKGQEATSSVQRDILEKLRDEGVTGLHLMPAQNFFGEDYEGTVDGSHPSDLGSMRMADALEPVVRNLLGMPA